MNETNRSYKLPNLLLNDEAVAEIRNSPFDSLTSLNILIFPLPPDVNCSGTVSSLRFCYRTRDADSFDQEHLVFTLWIMKRSGLNLNITNSIAVHSTPREDICTEELLKRQYCCDTILLNTTDKFSLPSENFSFGITSPFNNPVSLLKYSPFDLTSLRVNHYRFRNIPTPSVGSVYTLDNGDSDRTPLRLFQFIIGK